MRLSDLKAKIKPPYLPQSLYDEFENHVVIAPSTDELVPKSGKDDVWDCPIICLNNERSYLLTMKMTGSLSHVAELVIASYEKERCPIILTRNKKSNGYRDGQTQCFLDYSGSRMMEPYRKMATYYWAKTHRVDGYRAMADQFNAYCKRCDVTNDEQKLMLCHIGDWLSVNGYDIPNEATSMLAKVREYVLGLDMGYEQPLSLREDVRIEDEPNNKQEIYNETNCISVTEPRSRDKA